MASTGERLTTIAVGMQAAGALIVFGRGYLYGFGAGPADAQGRGERLQARLNRFARNSPTTKLITYLFRQALRKPDRLNNILSFVLCISISVAIILIVPESTKFVPHPELLFSNFLEITLLGLAITVIAVMTPLLLLGLAWVTEKILGVIGRHLIVALEFAGALFGGGALLEFVLNVNW